MLIILYVPPYTLGPNGPENGLQSVANFSHLYLVAKLVTVNKLH